jgi:hypothetical protein
MSPYIIKVLIVLAPEWSGMRRTMFALLCNARSLYCTSEHLNPSVVHILADAHPSDRRPFTTVAPGREVIMYGTNPYKRFHNPPVERISSKMPTRKNRENLCHGDRLRRPPIRSSLDDRSHSVRGNNVRTIRI